MLQEQHLGISRIPPTIHLFFILLSLIPQLAANAQEECATRFRSRLERNAYETRHQNFLQNQALERSTLTTYKYMPVYFHLVRNDNGTGGLSLTEALDALDRCNVAFSGTMIRFYYCGHQYIDNSAFVTFDSNQEAQLVDPNRVMDVINVFVVTTLTKASTAICGYAYYPNGTTNTNNHFLMQASCMNSASQTTFEHEMGHFFDLPHTHKGIWVNDVEVSEELVNGTNCTTAGDMFCDTPADPNLSGNVSTGCIYTGTATDANNATYNPNTSLIMSYSLKPCRTSFSPEQIAKMNFTVSGSGDISRKSLTCTNCGVSITHAPTYDVSVYLLGEYYGRNQINSNVDMSSSSVDQPNLKFIATERILLTPGFRFNANDAQLGQFDALIDPCGWNNP